MSWDLRLFLQIERKSFDRIYKKSCVRLKHSFSSHFTKFILFISKIKYNQIYQIARDIFRNFEKRTHSNDHMDCCKDRYYLSCPSLDVSPVQMNSIHHNSFARTFPPYFRLSSLVIRLRKCNETDERIGKRDKRKIIVKILELLESEEWFLICKIFQWFVACNFCTKLTFAGCGETDDATWVAPTESIAWHNSYFINTGWF